MKKGKVFVTGGSGFLGINLIRRLLNDNYEVILDRKDAIKIIHFPSFFLI